MNHLRHLMKRDIILLHRNRLFLIAAIIAALYTGLFFLLSSVGDLSLVVVILIFNDPVVTGYLFAGVLLLFDRNQNTILALSVLPVHFKYYLLSKSLVLSLLAAVIAFIMAFATSGVAFNPFHLFCSSFLAAFIFCCFGFLAASYSRTFNQFLFYSIPFFILAGVPFLRLFDYGQVWYYLIFPSAGGIELLHSAFHEQDVLLNLLMYMHLLLWSLLAWLAAVKAAKAKLI